MPTGEQSVHCQTTGHEEGWTALEIKVRIENAFVVVEVLVLAFFCDRGQMLVLLVSVCFASFVSHAAPIRWVQVI